MIYSKVLKDCYKSDIMSCKYIFISALLCSEHTLCAAHVCVCVLCLLLFYIQDRELTRWVHEAFLQSLDYSLLPVYLDVLQVLRSKVRSPL